MQIHVINPEMPCRLRCERRPAKELMNEWFHSEDEGYIEGDDLVWDGEGKFNNIEFFILNPKPPGCRDNL